MRQIEFRAWHKIESKMCKVTTLVPGKGAFLVGAALVEDQITKNFIIKAAEDGRFCNDFEYELEQFTGLLDKNGTKIFEGDVMQWPNQDETGVVIYDKNGCQFRIELKDATSLHIGLNIGEKGQAIVIGTIHDKD